MSATEEDRAYFAAAEAAFIRRRGTPFLLSPRDFALLREWRALGIPIEAVEDGIDQAFARREDRQAVGRVNSLSYCPDPVLEAWGPGRGAGGGGRAGGAPRTRPREPGASPEPSGRWRPVCRTAAFVAPPSRRRSNRRAPLCRASRCLAGAARRSRPPLRASTAA